MLYYPEKKKKKISVRNVDVNLLETTIIYLTDISVLFSTSLSRHQDVTPNLRVAIIALEVSPE